MAEYERCVALPGTAHAICEDYCASATIDLEHDRADRAAGKKVDLELRVLWGHTAPSANASTSSRGLFVRHISMSSEKLFTPYLLKVNTHRIRFRA
jgi:hypothetical protein